MPTRVAGLLATWLSALLVLHAGPAVARDSYSDGADEATAGAPRGIPPGLARTPQTLLLARLFRAIERISPYAYPGQFPSVQAMSRAELARLVCGSDECGARAVFLPGAGIFIDAALDPENLDLDQSILVHELVHYLQDEKDAYAKLPRCRRQWELEREAYIVQRRYLEYIGSRVRVGDHGGSRNCTPEPQ